jgi:hypothetical protein
MGRPPKAVTARKGLQAAEILENVDEVKIWRELLESDDLRVKADAIKYLTDRRDGKAKQTIEMSEADKLKSLSDEELRRQLDEELKSLGWTLQQIQ